MKNRIIASLSVLFAVFTIGAVISMLYINFTTSRLQEIITLHDVEILRQDLIIKIQNVEQDLLTVHTELGSRLDKIVSNVSDLDKSINRCTVCHHSPVMTRKLHDVRGLIERFETSLSYYITASANEERIKALKMESYTIGTELLNMTSEMALIANKRLQDRTQNAINDVQRAQRILVVTLFFSFVSGLWIATRLARKIIRPVRELIGVSRKIAGGNLGCTTSYTDTTEFGELAASINDMSVSLKESNEKIVQHMSRLAGLYRVTLPLHTVSTVTDIVREVSRGVAELIGVEQCGVLLADEQGEYLEHALPAHGLEEAQARAIRVSRGAMETLCTANNRRPLIINDFRTGVLPEGIAGEKVTEVRNLLIGWVRVKDDFIGVIRLANRTGGDFQMESSRLLGIISNNISVAFENIRLYEDLRAQMKELKETQEQLVQAAKLAAIGELASNVAHEINNPLTSILGFAELIKEEESLECIMKDVEIIKRESMRAREIVQQLLEFARRRPLEVRVVDVNSLLRDVVMLIGVRLKDASIRIREEYSELPDIMGDPNQIKQVFLNVLTNSLHAMSENGPEKRKEIRIRTSNSESSVCVEISDTGHGISSDVLPKIFEPFFTTKREEGTGLGLSITYKIIQSHKGNIDVKSEEGRGTKFTISLPIYMAGSAGEPAHRYGHVRDSGTYADRAVNNDG